MGLRALDAQVVAVRGGDQAKVGLPSFKQYREPDGRFYFKLTGVGGQVLLQSRGFESPRDAGQAVKRLQTEGGAALAALADRLEPVADTVSPDLADALQALQIAQQG